MKIGIKYCGGCNSRYDRTKEVNKFIKRFPNHTYIYNVEEEICDLCLLVCGCMTGCASSEGIAAKRFISLCTHSSLPRLLQILPKKKQHPTYGKNAFSI